MQNLITDGWVRDLGLFEAPRLQDGASRARSGEQNVSQGDLIYIVPLDPAYPARAGRGTSRSINFGGMEGVFLQGPDGLQPGA